MQDFTMSLRDLVEREMIDRATAFEVAPNPEALKMALKGIDAQRSRQCCESAWWKISRSTNLMAKTSRGCCSCFDRLSPWCLLARRGYAVGRHDDWASTPLGKDFRGPGVLPQLDQDSRLLAGIPAVGVHHGLAQHRLPGVEAGLPALEPNRLRHVHAAIRVAVADSVLLARLPLVA